MLRCTVCGHCAPFREGMRYCAACAAPLPLAACPACRKENFHGDRFCAFCAKPLPGALAGPATAGPLEPGVLPVGQDEAADLLALAAEARARAQSAQTAPPPTTKRHLGQDDIDALFGGPSP